jgi:hypothetical protein
LTTADWWARVVQARTEHDDLLPKRVWALQKDGHEAAIDVKAVPGIGAEIVLTVDGELRRSRLYRSHEQAELVGAIADTRARLRGRGGSDLRSDLSCDGLILRREHRLNLNRTHFDPKESVLSLQEMRRLGYELAELLGCKCPRCRVETPPEHECVQPCSALIRI